MRLFASYLRHYWKLVLLALLLAATNQVFSLLDPLIFRHIIDEYATAGIAADAAATKRAGVRPTSSRAIP